MCSIDLQTKNQIVLSEVYHWLLKIVYEPILKKPGILFYPRLSVTHEGNVRPHTIPINRWKYMWK